MAKHPVKLIAMWILLVCSATLSVTVFCQSSSDCLACHQDRTLTASINGRDVSAFVDADVFKNSVHGEFQCIDCHTDLSGSDFPHSKVLKPVNCGDCHGDVLKELEKGPHAKWARTPADPSTGCTMCHGRHDVEGAQNPKSPVSRQKVGALCKRCHAEEARLYRTSVHSALKGGRPGAACISCHKGHSMARPKTEDVELETCGACHKEEADRQSRSVHARAALKGDPLAPSCITCHKHHAILSQKDPTSPTARLNVPYLCGSCHHEGTKVSLERHIPEKNILSNYSLSIHGQGLFKMGLSVTAVCTSCHMPHLILAAQNPQSSINRRNVVKTCTQCHSRIEQVHVKVISGKLWEKAPHKIPSCIDCHRPHKIRRTPLDLQRVANKECLSCHSDRKLTFFRDGEKRSLFVDEKAFLASRHGSVACAQCHNEVSTAVMRPCASIKNKVDCSICHAEVVGLYQTGIHGKEAAAGNPLAPKCMTCHSAHSTVGHKNPDSPTYPRNVPKLCGRCHTKGQPVADAITRQLPQAHDIVSSYGDSVHGRALMKAGLVVSANCAACHTAHHELPKSDPDSSVNPAYLADTCGACHSGIVQDFKRSIHWTGKASGGKKLPICEDCHTSHSISRIDTKGFRTTMMQQCGKCHEEEAKSYFETVHGKVTRLGDEGAAKCYDCHGIHNILPPEDPASTLSYQNVIGTCKQCHPGAQRQFAGYLTHATHHNRKKYPYLFLAFWGMTVLLVGTLTFFLAHTLLWLWRLWKEREVWRPLKSLHRSRFYVRFSPEQRLMHLVMMLSFFTLAITGMTIKFSYMGWAVTLSRSLGGFAVTGVLHRMAACLLIGLFLFHLWQVRSFKKKSGAGWFKFIFAKDSMMFNLKDLTQFRQSLKWFIGRGERPAYGRFSYWEKFDYFAVFWGIAVIGTTGLMLWFPTVFTLVLPGWTTNVATIIHSDEALLATAFIFTIHFFNTHFRPDKFPIDPVIFTGRVSLDELKHDKPEEYEALMAMDDPETRIAGSMPVKRLKWIKLFGFVALSVGLVLIFLILYAMIFGYR